MRAVLPRQLGTGDAVVLGLAAMLGTGVFTVFAPAARYAGDWLLLAILLAGVVAACNAFSTADLAARHPESGGGYVYGRERLSPWAGRLAGVAFLVGKIASAAAAGGVFGSYVLPSQPLGAAIPAILVVGLLNALGVRWTARGAWVMVPGVLAVLALVVVIGLAWRIPPDWSVPGLAGGNLGDTARGAEPVATVPLDNMAELSAPVHPVTPFGVFTAAGMVFFAFAGYARIATLGEEVRDPTRTLRRAIPMALLIILVTYLAVGGALLHALGAPRLALEAAPLAAAVGGANTPALGVLVRTGAAAATVSALLSVLVGVSRTTFAMARQRDLPGWLAVVGKGGTPWRADVAGTTAAVLVVVFAGPVAAIALSACSVLVYYSVINLAALRLPAAERRWPAWTSVLGLVLCLGLAVLLPLTQVLVTAGVLGIGVLASGLLAGLPDRGDKQRPGRGSEHGAGQGAAPGVTAADSGPDSGNPGSEATSR